MSKANIFISYSHQDEEWKDRVVTQLRVLQMQELIDVWDDRRIEAGDEWHVEIENALKAANVAVLLITANFLTSKFILGEEVPRLLERRATEGVRIIPLIVKPCAWQQVSWLSSIQARPKDGRALSAGDDNQIDTDLTALAQEIVGAVPKKLGDERSEKLANIRRRLFVATTLPELMQLKYEIEAFLASYPADVEGKILQDDIELARQRELARLQPKPPLLYQEGRSRAPMAEKQARNLLLLPIGCIAALVALIGIAIYILQNWK